HADYYARDQVVRRGECKPRRREQRAADGRRVEAGAREQLRHKTGPTVAEDETVGDDQAGERERQRDHERARGAPPRRQPRQMQRDRDTDGRRKRGGDQRQHAATSERRPEPRRSEKTPQSAATLR